MGALHAGVEEFHEVLPGAFFAHNFQRNEQNVRQQPSAKFSSTLQAQVRALLGDLLTEAPMSELRMRENELGFTREMQDCARWLRRMELSRFHAHMHRN